VIVPALVMVVPLPMVWWPPQRYRAESYNRSPLAIRHLKADVLSSGAGLEIVQFGLDLPSRVVEFETLDQPSPTRQSDGGE
jgi:hypothetical protein